MQNHGFRRAISGTEDSGRIGDCQLVRLLEQLTNESETCNAVSYIVPEYQTYFQIKFTRGFTFCYNGDTHTVVQ